MGNRVTKQLMARAVFSDTARAAFHETDRPITAYDAATGITLIYRFEPHAGGVLRLTGGAIGERVLTIACDEADRDLVATLLLDGIRRQCGRLASPRLVPVDRRPG